MQKFDLVLLPFPFTDLSRSKIRPAVILINDLASQDVTVCFITSRLNIARSYDVILNPDNSNGFKVKSAIKVSKIATVRYPLIKGRLGTLGSSDQSILDKNLKQLLKLNQ